MIDVCNLSPAAIDEQRIGGRLAALEANVEERPLLSSLAISPRFRRRGLAKRLCREAEAQASEWGYPEVLLRVERDNGKARNLYRKVCDRPAHACAARRCATDSPRPPANGAVPPQVGYRVVALDKDAERPEAGPGGLRYVPTVQVIAALLPAL